MAHDRHTRAQLRRAYVDNQLSLRQAAAHIGIHATTASRWKAEAKSEGDCWEKAQAQIALIASGKSQAQQPQAGSISELAQQTAAQILPEFRHTIRQLSNADIDPIKRVSLLASITDAHAKLINTVSKLQPDTSNLTIALATLKQLTDFVMTEEPDIAGTILPVLEEFGQLLVEQSK